MSDFDEDLDVERKQADAVLVTDASSEGDAICASLRAEGFDVIETALASLEARIAVDAPKVIIVDVDHPDAISTIERLHQSAQAEAPTVLLVGDPVVSAELDLEMFGQVFERPVDIAELTAHVASVASPSRVGRTGRTTLPPSYPPPHIDTSSPEAVESEAPSIPDFSSEIDALDGEEHAAPKLVPSSISSELQALLLAAEQRVTANVHASSVPPEHDDADLMLPAELLSMLDEPIDGEDDDLRTGLGSASGTPLHTISALTPAGGTPAHRIDSFMDGTSPDAQGSPVTAATELRRVAPDPHAAPMTIQDLEASEQSLAASVQETELQSPSLGENATAGETKEADGRPVTKRTGAENVPAVVTPPRNIRVQGAAMTDEPSLRGSPFGSAVTALESSVGSMRMHARAVAPLPILGRPPSSTPSWDQVGMGPISPLPNTTSSALGRMPVEHNAAYVPLSIESNRSGRVSVRIEHAPVSTRAPAPEVLAAGDAPRALARAIATRASGAFAVTAEEGTRRVVLNDGDVVTAGSDVDTETLLAFLATRGDLEPDVASRLLGKLPASGRHAGAALVAHGHLGQDDLWPVLRAHAEWLIGHTLLVPSGTCQLEQEPPGRLKAEPNVFGGATGAEVFVESVRRVISYDVALKRLGSAQSRIGLAARQDLLSECALSPKEEELVRSAEGRTVAELIEASDVEIATVLYALMCLEVIELFTPASVADSQRSPVQDPLDEEAIRKRVRARIGLVENGDYFAVLGIARDATNYEVRRAYVALRRAFEPSRFLTAATVDLVDDVRLILEVLDEAYEILREPQRRERYRRAIEAGPP